MEGPVNHYQRTQWQRLVLRCALEIPHRYEFSWLHIGNVTSVSGLEDLLEVFVAILVIPEVRAEAGTDTGRPLLFSLIPFHSRHHQPSPLPPILRSHPLLPSHSRLYSRSPLISVSVFLFSFYPPLQAHMLSSPIVPFPFFPRLQPTLALSSSILRLSILFTPAILLTQLFSKNCSFSCCFPSSP